MNTRTATRVAAILLLNLCLFCATFSQTTVVVSPASGIAALSERYDVSVVVNNVTNLHSSGVTISFDATVLRYDSTTAGAFLTGSTSFVTPSTSQGVTSVLVDQAILGAGVVSGSGTLFTLHVTALQRATVPFTLSGISLRDGNNGAIAFTPTSGNVTVGTPLLGMTVFLEGPYISGPPPSMTKALNAPATHLSTRYTGATIPTNAVDSVNIEIRNATTALGSTVRRFAPAWLMTDGTLRSFANIYLSGVAFDAPSGAYYVVVRHRNHLAIMSSATVALTTSPASYNFTLATSAAYGTGAMKALVGSRFGMFAADANGSGDVSILDRAAWRTQNSQTGYMGADFNLTGDVSILDRGLWRNNNSLASQVP